MRNLFRFIFFGISPALFKSIVIFFMLSLTGLVYAQCPTQVEKITPTTNFYDFNGATAAANMPITSIPATTGWTGSYTMSNNDGTPFTGSPDPATVNQVFAGNDYTLFNQQMVNGHLDQFATHPITNANPLGTGAKVTLVVWVVDSGTPGYNMDFYIRYGNSATPAGNPIYGTISSAINTNANATVTASNGATLLSPATIAVGGYRTITIQLPPGIPNNGNIMLHYAPASFANPANGTADDIRVQSVSFLACPDLDSDDDGILDTAEGYCQNSLFDIGWTSNTPPGTLTQDIYWPTAPAGSSIPGRDTSIAATADSFVWGSGISHTQDGTRWQLSGVNQSSLANAKANNDYIQYSFTTPAALAGYHEISKFGWASTPNINEYWVGAEVSTNAFTTPGTLLLENFIIPVTGSYTYLSATSLVNKVHLLPNTTYTFRIYVYGASAAGTPVRYDDFQIGTCQSLDTDSDGIPDFQDLDSDGDGCPDAIEGDETVQAGQLNPNGSINTTASGGINGNGVPNLVNSGGTADIGGDVGQDVGVSTSTLVNYCTDTDHDGIPDIEDIDKDNDGISDTDEGYCQNSLFDAGWFSNTPAGTLVQDRYWPTAPTGTNMTGRDTNIAASAGNMVWGSGITRALDPNTSNRWILSSINESSLANARSNNDYVQYSFTTPTTLTGYHEISKFGWSSALNGNAYRVGVEISANAFSTAGTLLLENFTIPASTPYLYLIGSPLNNKIHLLPNTTYTLRVYIYGLATSNLEARYDDFQFGTCQSLDTDGDGTPDFLDLDSDGDGCPDAIEGDENVLNEHLNTDGSINTTANGGVNGNGVPNLVNNGGIADTGGDVGQGTGGSVNALVNSCFCYKNAVISGTSLDTTLGITSLGRAGINNGNWPMARKGGWIALEAKTKGFVPNRLTTVQKNSLIPVEGMMVYDTNLDCLSIYDGLGWKCFNVQTCP